MQPIKSSNLPKHVSLFPAAIALLVAPMSLDAATITHQTMGLLSGPSDTDSPTISVFAGNSFLQSAHSVPSVYDVGTVNLGTVIDYAFFAANTTSSSATAYAAGSSAIVGTSVSNSGTNGTQSRAINQVYTTNDPGALTPTPNFTNRQFTVGSNNILTGTFDLAPLAGGNMNDLEIYLISGGWNSFTNLSVTETGQPTQSFTISNALAGQREQYLNKITISGFDGTESFTYTMSGGNNNPTFTGIIVTQVPEPNAALLSGLGLLALLRRRR